MKLCVLSSGCESRERPTRLFFEIFDARQFPIEDYLSDEKIGQYNKVILQSALKYSGLKSVKLPGYMDSDDEYEVFMS